MEAVCVPPVSCLHCFGLVTIFGLFIGEAVGICAVYFMEKNCPVKQPRNKPPKKRIGKDY